MLSQTGVVTRPEAFRRQDRFFCLVDHALQSPQSSIFFTAGCARFEFDGQWLGLIGRVQRQRDQAVSVCFAVVHFP